MFGKNWNFVHQYVGTRTSAQTRSHAQKYFNKLIKYKETGEGLTNETLEHLALIGYGQGKTGQTSPRNQFMIERPGDQKKAEMSINIEKLDEVESESDSLKKQQVTQIRSAEETKNYEPITQQDVDLMPFKNSLAGQGQD